MIYRCFLLISAGALFISGCASMGPKPYESIWVGTLLPRNQDCSYVGRVSAYRNVTQQSHMIVRGNEQETRRQVYSDLKAQAYAQGGNAVQLDRQDFYYNSNGFGGATHYKESGKAFSCAPTVVPTISSSLMP